MKYFINWTNHSFDEWSEEQKEQIKTLFPFDTVKKNKKIQIVDFLFPKIVGKPDEIDEILSSFFIFLVEKNIPLKNVQAVLIEGEATRTAGIAYVLQQQLDISCFSPFREHQFIKFLRYQFPSGFKVIV